MYNCIQYLYSHMADSVQHNVSLVFMHVCVHAYASLQKYRPVPSGGKYHPVCRHGANLNNSTPLGTHNCCALIMRGLHAPWFCALIKGRLQKFRYEHPFNF